MVPERPLTKSITLHELNRDEGRSSSEAPSKYFCRDKDLATEAEYYLKTSQHGSINWMK